MDPAAGVFFGKRDASASEAYLMDTEPEPHGPEFARWYALQWLENNGFAADADEALQASEGPEADI